MNAAWAPSYELADLVDAVCSDQITAQQTARLEQLVLADSGARRYYVRYLHVHASLPQILSAHEDADFEGLCGTGEASDEELAEESAPPSSSSAMPISMATDSISSQEDSLPAYGFAGNLWHGTIGFFSQEIPFSLLIASLVTGLGLLAGSMIYVSHHKQIAKNTSRPTTPLTKSDVEFVGRITGMVDVRWSDNQTATVHGANVPLGRKYALSSGLMEITYDTGAKVVLQGPVTYEVDSRVGGFLSVGKLVARVEKREVDKLAIGQRPLDSKSQIPNSTPLFTIKTPTATVTDLGTEFAVEVKPDRATVVHVIRGVVEATRDVRTGGQPVRERLVAGEAIRFAAITDPPDRMHSRSARVVLSPDIKAALLQAQEARASQILVTPTGLVASTYHHIWDADGKQLAENDRQAAFRVVTDGQFGRGENGSPARSSFDTYDSKSSSSQTDFVGLTYDACMRFDRIKVFLGRQSEDGGIWREMPRIFILKAPVDTGGTPPENDPVHWRELSLHSLYGISFDAKPGVNPGEVIELLLTGIPELERIGYGWALGGVAGNGKAHYVSITELRAYGISLPDPNPTQGAKP